ncbi:RNA polymerase sigma factor [bacterium D16-51]|nr:RNA polymerase sigma factor [bacterium D16-59]RKI59110.1 RNA polymerase sigma factor [bacterium D16-51]
MNVTELEKCIELYGKDIYAFCRQLTYSRQEAEELYQDTFLKAMELLQKINASENPKSYLLSIALRNWKNHKKKYACRKRIADMESLSEEMEDAEKAGSYSLEEEVLAKERASEVQRAVRQLDDKHRLPVYLYYMEELPLQEIASVLKIPKGTVKSRLYQARESLRNMLEVDEYER